MLAGLTSILLVVAAATDAPDVAAIKDLQSRQAAAWNEHDAAAYAALFTDDGDVVNVMGWRWKGRDEIQRKLTEAFQHVFRESRLTIKDVDVKVLDARFAVAHVRWEMEGAKAPPGAPAPPREGIQLQILQKTSDGWRIVGFQNTNTLPERPFPRTP